MSVRERAEHLITLADAATEGPWDDFQRDNETGYWVVRYCYGPGDPAFISAARTEAPWLARQLVEALGRIEQLEAERSEYVSMLARIDAKTRKLDTVTEIKEVIEGVLSGRL